MAHNLQATINFQKKKFKGVTQKSEDQGWGPKRFIKYKYFFLIEIQIFVQLWFKYKYIDSTTNTFNQIYLRNLFRSKIGQFNKSQDTCSWSGDSGQRVPYMVAYRLESLFSLT